MGKNKITMSIRLFLLIIVIGAVIIAPIQIFFWGIWDEGIKVNLDAEQSACLRRISYLQQERDTGEFVNIERAGEDKLVFTLGERCERVINNHDFEYRKRMKTSMFFRTAWWVLILVVALFVTLIVWVNESDDNDGNNYY